MNFLEQLVAEWYAYKGYFVRTNIKFGKRTRGGYEGEMDVVAFDPKEKILVHLETSSSAEKWEERKEKFQKKFKTSAKHYKSIFRFEFKEIRKIAIAGSSKPRKPIDLGNDIDLVSVPEMIAQITKEMEEIDPRKRVIPERYPLLRAIQYGIWFRSSKGEC